VVRRAQAALNALGYRLGTPDGALGRKTVDALKAQQRKRGRPADAAVDEALVALLEADIADATRAAEERRIADQQRQEIERQVALRLEAERRTSEAARLAAERKAAAEEASRREAERATAERARLAVEQQQRQAAERRAAEERKAAEAERRAEEDRLAAARREPELARAETPPPPPEPAAATVASTTATPIPGRVALVIGNGAYTSVPGLPNPPNDAADVAVLERLGFRVLKGTDLERDAMVDLVEEFARAASEADVALAYFAGHGLQVRDVNYLIPVDGRVQDEFGLRRLVRLDELIEDTGRARKLALVVVDACR
jgi:hypothetical protein